jgi:hypothetical protein
VGSSNPVCAWSTAPSCGLATPTRHGSGTVQVVCVCLCS